MPPAVAEYRIWMRMTARAIDEPHRTASPLELLFDLTFVVAVAAVTAQFAHDVADGHALSGTVPFLEVFFAVWWAWMNFTWFASSYDTDDAAYRLLTMVQMAGVLTLAAGVPATGADPDFRLITAGYLVMRVALVAQWLRAAAEHPERRRTALRYAAGITTLEACWILRLALAEAGALPDRVDPASFVVLAALELAVPWWAERSGPTAWHPHHIAERYGLFTIILFGESVLATSNGVRAALDASAAGGSLVVIAGSGLVLLFALWWLYFLLPSGEGLSDRRHRSYLWGYGHYGVFAALAALGAGLEVAVERTGHHLAVSPIATCYAVAAPTALFVVLLQLTHAPSWPHTSSRPRWCCAARQPPCSCPWRRRGRGWPSSSPRSPSSRCSRSSRRTSPRPGGTRPRETHNLISPISPISPMNWTKESAVDGTERRTATPVLVIGSGGAGLRAAIELAERGVGVLVVGKRPKADAHTTLAAGGINAALGTMDPQDSWQQHAADTIQEGYLLSDPDIVRIVTENAARGIDDLVRYGMPFAREADGRISQRFFGAHTWRRTAFSGDYTGLEIQRALVRRAAELDVPILDTTYITRLLVHDNAVCGAYGFDLDDGSRRIVHADAVILATGGHTRIWRHTSSRRDENTGDTVRLAVLAGARIRDPELVQFHPSGLVEPEDAAGTLVSEAARGEGGRLFNALGERFMERYDPVRMELSTRDRVALAAYTEIKEGRGTPKGGVWLDVSHLPRETIMTRLPRVHRTLLDLQMLDITEARIEIAPTAHYSMGGVRVRPEDSGTDVAGLYAIGEAAGGLHGANRLGGNSLAELLVYGRITGEAAAAYSASLRAQPRSADAVAEARREVDDLLALDGPENARVLQRAVRDTMTEHAGVVRDEAGLLRGLAELDAIEDRATRLGIHPDNAGYQDLAHAFDLKGTAMAARATLEAALERRETRGCHNRSDHPDLDPSLRVSLVWAGPGRLAREMLPPVPPEITSLMREVSSTGKLVE